MIPMMIYGGYFAYRLQYLLFMLPALILMMAAQWLVSSRYKQYGAIPNRTSPEREGSGRTHSSSKRYRSGRG